MNEITLYLILALTAIAGIGILAGAVILAEWGIRRINAWFDRKIRSIE